MRDGVVTLHTRENPLLDALQADGCEIVQVQIEHLFSEQLFDNCARYFSDVFINVTAPLHFVRLKFDDFDHTRSLAENLHNDVIRNHPYRDRACHLLQLVHDFTGRPCEPVHTRS